MSTKVSVIMPSLNVCEYIDGVFAGVCRQTLKEIEIISIDAGSNDGTREIIQKWADKDTRIIVIDSKKRSYGYQVNLGIDVAHGEYIAIMETDDIVDPNMYEFLYDVATIDNLDYVKSNYYVYLTTYSGEKLSFIRSVFPNDKNLYNKIIKPLNCYAVGVYDYYLWNGIYKRSFLQENNITLNETPGAAYQDAGFIYQTLIHGERVKYITKPFYHYCLDRENSSSNSGKSLSYFAEEFSLLYPLLDNASERELSFFYIRMARAFPFCCRREMYIAGANNSDIQTKYGWFRHKLERAIEENVLQSYMLGENLWNELSELLNLSWDDATRQKLKEIEKIHDAVNIVIFGCGYQGYCACRYLRGIHKKPFTFLDNNSELWGKIIDGIPVQAPQSCVNFPTDVTYIIANDIHHQDIRCQLLSLGVREDKICRYD